MDILLDTQTHDIVIDGYDLALVEGSALVRQRVEQRLEYFFGEWYLATDEGVPYFEEILVKAPDRARVESLLKATIIDTEGVDALLSFDLDYDAAQRRMSLTFEVRVGEDIATIDATLGGGV